MSISKIAFFVCLLSSAVGLNLSKFNFKRLQIKSDYQTCIKKSTISSFLAITITAIGIFPSASFAYGPVEVSLSNLKYKQANNNFY